MALGSSPTRDNIIAEFGSNTRNANITEGSLKQADAHIFGGTGDGYTREGFANTGQPSVGAITATSTGPFSMDVTANLADIGGLTTFMQVQYSTTSDFSSNVTTEAEVGYPSIGNKTQSIPGLSASTLYYVRVRVFNNFNNGAPADHKVSATDSTTTDAPPKFTTPSMSQIYYGSNNFDAVIAGGSSGSTWANDYEVQSESGANNWQLLTNTANSGWGTSGTKTGTWTLIGNENDPPKVRIRAKEQGQIVASNWSSEFTVMKEPTNAQVSQTNPTSANVTATWSNPIGYASYSIVLEWYRNGSLHSTDNLSSGSTSSNKTFSDTNSIYIKVRYVGGDWAQSSAITINVQDFDPDVTTMSATSIFETGATLRMDLQNVSGYTAQYQFEYRETGNTTWIQLLGSLATTTTNGTKTYNVTGLDSNTGYDFRGRARNQDISGPWQYGGSESFTTLQATQVLAPQSVQYSTPNNNSLDVSWTIPSGQPTGVTYRIEVEFGNGYQYAGSVTDSSSFTDNNPCATFGFSPFTFNSILELRVQAQKLPDTSLWITGFGSGTIVC